MIKIGGTSIGKVYVGANEITKAYVGSDVVYNSAPPVLPYDAQVEYLETSGTQYISTGYAPSSITPIVEFSIYKPAVSSSYYPMGADGSGTNVRFSIGFLTKNRIQIRIGSQVGLNSTVGWHTIKMDTTNGEYYLDGVKQGTSRYKTCTSTMPILLFTSYSESDAVRTILSGVKIDTFKLWNGSTLLLDLIPVRVGQVGYMYNKVNNTLLANAGTGDFILGNDVN